MKIRHLACLATALCSLAAPAPAQEASPAVAEATGLVVDLGPKPFTPVLSLRISDEQGKTLYGDMPELSPAQATELIDKGMADFAESWKDVTARCGEHPLVVKGIAAIGDDIRVTNKAAAAIKDADSHTGFLKELKVCIVSSTRAENTGPEVAIVEPQVADAKLPATGPKSLPLRQVAAWKKFNPGSVQAQNALRTQFKLRHPRLAAMLRAIQDLKPAERKVVRQFFPLGTAKNMTPAERQARRREFRTKYPAIAAKLRAAFKEEMGG